MKITKEKFFEIGRALNLNDECLDICWSTGPKDTDVGFTMADISLYFTMMIVMNGGVEKLNDKSIKELKRINENHVKGNETTIH